MFLMKNQNKYKIFEPMSNTFETDLIKRYFLDMVQEIPDYIFTMPSSTSGKYHNKTQCETYGQIYHIYMFSEIKADGEMAKWLLSIARTVSGRCLTRPLSVPVVDILTLRNLNCTKN